jgi:hypothetical protein
LTYSFGYLSSATDEVEIFLSLRKRSEIAFATSKLPRDHRLMCKVTAHNDLDASTLMRASVTVYPQKLTSKEFNELIVLELNATSEETDSQPIINVITLGITTLNDVNCSRSPNCTSINRAECVSKDHTCGPCLLSYHGEAESDNTLCLLDNDPVSSNSTLNQSCVDDTDCQGLQSCSDHQICEIPMKSCSENCSDQGMCAFFSCVFWRAC